MQASVQFDTQHHAGIIDRRIFGGFLEHLGRSIYEGVYDPGNKLSDENGFRRDVLDVLRPMAMPIMRYPGGNFVSCYDWKDGIGPRNQRPSRPDFAWQSVETNQFGTDEFMAWCKKLNTAPMMAVNLGTGNPGEAAHLLEYCNLTTPTYWADRRRQNGHPEPYNVKLWCLGNEMDGPWQAGHVPAEVYAQRARMAGALMRKLDNSIETIICGSSNRGMPTYLEWDRKCLEYAWDFVDYISAHRYSNNTDNDSPAFLAEGVEIDRVLEDYAGLLGYVRGMKRSNKKVHLSFDEWNVWYRHRSEDGGWSPAPHLLEEVYNMEDAIVCAQYLSAFLRRADLVKVACLAQVVNVIAPILTRPDGLLIQSIYYPFVMFSQNAQGVSLTPVIQSPTYKAGSRGDAPVLDASGSFNRLTGTASFFLINRHQTDELTVEIELADARPTRLIGVESMGGCDVKAANSWEKPDTIKPSAGKGRILDNGRLQVTVPAPGLSAARVQLAT